MSHQEECFSRRELVKMSGTDSQHLEVKYAQNTASEDAASLNLKIEQSLNRKYDFHMLPFLFFIYLFSFMDRASIGNAAIAGLNKDLKLVGEEYSTALALFFVIYMLVDVPAAWVFKLAGPGRFLGASILCFGICTIGIGFVKTAKQLYALRCLLGLFEGGLTPCLFLYISLFYRRFDCQRRVAWFYIAAPLSGAIGGLLASGLGKIQVRSYKNWPWIFIIEGIITIFISFATLGFLPNFPSGCKFLSEEEMACARIRSGDHGTADRQGVENEKFSWRKARKGLLDTNTILLSLASIGTYCNVYSYSLFSPTIINHFGYDVLHSQLLSVPPYVFAAVGVIVTSYFSDRLQIRGLFVIGACFTQAIGWMIQCVAKSTGALYFGLFITALGVFCQIPPLTVWLSNNLAPHYSRATGLSVSVAMGTIGGIISTFAFSMSKAHQGYYIQIGMNGWSAALAAILMLLNYRENKLRARGGRDDRLGGDTSEEELGSKHPSFVLSL